jgi:hypothetical protein
MVDEKMASDDVQANDLLEAFLQWVALVPTIKPDDTFVMLKSPVDKVFHAFILNTEFYQNFCARHFGFFVHHHPIDELLLKKLPGGVRDTMDLLEQTYGEELHPALSAWRSLVDTDAYVVSCAGYCASEDDYMQESVVGKLPSGATLVH